MDYATPAREVSTPEPQSAHAPATRKNALAAGAVRPNAAEKGSGIDLGAAIRAKMEKSFGDLSGIRFYRSQAVADAGANAIAAGSEIAFAPGMDNFNTRRGQELLGHELSHVALQRRGQVRGSGFLDSPALESMADREGVRAAAGERAAVPLSAASAAPTVGPMQASKPKKGPAPQAPAAPQAPVAAPEPTVAPTQAPVMAPQMPVAAPQAPVMAPQAPIAAPQMPQIDPTEQARATAERLLGISMTMNASSEDDDVLTNSDRKFFAANSQKFNPEVMNQLLLMQAGSAGSYLKGRADMGEMNKISDTAHDKDTKSYYGYDATRYRAAADLLEKMKGGGDDEQLKKWEANRSNVLSDDQLKDLNDAAELSRNSRDYMYHGIVKRGASGTQQQLNIIQNAKSETKDKILEEYDDRKWH